MAKRKKPAVPEYQGLHRRGVDRIRPDREPVRAELVEPTTAPPGRPGSGAPSSRPRPRPIRPSKVTGATRDVGYLAALSRDPGSTSVVGSTATGAAAGAATGAAIGSAVPVVGPIAGGAGGAVVGGAGGAVGASKRRRAARNARQPWRRALVAEFAFSIVVVALAPMSEARRDEPPARWMRQASAVVGLFFVLGLIASIGRGAAKAAVGLGALVAVTLAISERSLFTTIAKSVVSKGGRRAGPDSDDDAVPTGKAGRQHGG